MRRIIAWCVAGLPFEPRSRRAIDETLADWAHEEQESPTRGVPEIRLWDSGRALRRGRRRGFS